MQGSRPSAQGISSPRRCIPIMEQTIQGRKISASRFFFFFLTELTKLDPWGSCSQCDGVTSKLVGYPEFQLLMDVGYHSPGEPHCGISIVPVQRLVVYY